MGTRYRRPKSKPEPYEMEVEFSRHDKKLRYLRARRKYRKLQINLKRLRNNIKIIAILLITIGIWKLAHLPQWYLNADVLSKYPNPYLNIEGNEIIADNQIMETLNKVKLPHDPIYLLNTRLLESALYKLSPVRKVYIRRFWFPARLKIVIDEKNPVFAITPSLKVNPVAVFTDNASIINKKYLPLHYHKRLFSVFTYADYTKWNSKQVNSLIYLASLLEEVTEEKLIYLDFRNPDDIFAQMEKVRFRLGEMDPTIYKRAKRATPAVIKEALDTKNDIDYLDLRWDNSIAIKVNEKEKPKVNDKDKDKVKDKKEQDKKQEPNPNPKKPDSNDHVAQKQH